MEKVKVTKNQIISELTKSPHGKLREYLAIGQLAAQNEPDFLAHLIAWDRTHGQIRDAKAALPIVSLTVPGFPQELVENSLAHLTFLNPRELLKAYRFALDVRPLGHIRQLKRVIADYLHMKEGKKWDFTAIQHRAVLKELYSLADVKPGSDRVNIVLFGHTLEERLKAKAEGRQPVRSPLPKGSIFEAVANLRNMSSKEAAGTILERKIPFLIAHGALGNKIKDPDLVLALIERMSPTEVVTSTKMLEKLGVKEVPALRAAFEDALKRAAVSKKNVLKTTRAAEAIGDEKLKAKLHAVQEKQIQNMSIEGNWLILGDKSGSMSQCIEASRHVAGTLAKMVKGSVTLTFFDQTPLMIDVTGFGYEEILKKTRNVNANGGTSIGCGLRSAMLSHIEIDGIAIVSDGLENSPPFFSDEYRRLLQVADKDIPVYFYRCGAENRGWGDQEFAESMKKNGFDLQVFELGIDIDYYSIPNLVQSMRTNPYSLVDEIMATPLLKLSEAFSDGNQED
jgi:hypothetical protein